VQQTHRERTFIIDSERNVFVSQELAKVRSEFEDGGWLTPTGGSGLKKNAVCDFAGAAETLPVPEAIISPESADGLAFALNER